MEMENNPLSNIRQWVRGFLENAKAQGRRKRTLLFYSRALDDFLNFCDTNSIGVVEAVTPNHLRSYLVGLQEAGHNPGGVRCYYQQIRCFFNWYDNEENPEGWKNPVKKVAMPTVPEKILDPVSLEDVSALLKTCDGSFVGVRDKAILFALLDTGARSGELVAFDVADLDLLSGTLIIRESKTGKGRAVYLGHRARRMMWAWLRVRGAKAGPLFRTTFGTRLCYQGLRQMIRRRADMAGIDDPPLHSFRRACGVNLVRAGESVFAAQRILGHASLNTTKQYVKLVAEDLRAAIERSSPGDRL